MPPDLSRRALLAAAGGIGMGALSGCSSLSRRPLGSLPAPPPAPVEDLSVQKVRVAEVASLFGEEPLEVGTRETTHEFLTSSSELAELAFSTDREAGRRLQRFAEDTDFGARSVFLFQSTVGACEDYHLIGVRYADGNLDTEFCVDLRPADVSCEADSYETVAYAIRLPFTDVSLSSIGFGTDYGCDGAIARDMGYGAGNSGGGGNGGSGDGGSGGDGGGGDSSGGSGGGG